MISGRGRAGGGSVSTVQGVTSRPEFVWRDPRPGMSNLCIPFCFSAFQAISGKSRAEQQPQRRIPSKVGCPAAAAEVRPVSVTGLLLGSAQWFRLMGSAHLFLHWALAQYVSVHGFCPSGLLLGSAQYSPVQSGSVRPVRSRMTGLVQKAGSVQFCPVRSDLNV